METPIILRTKNYSLFHFYKSNRKITHHAKIVKSIEKEDLTPFNPIVVDENMFIIDGQNRFAACKELGIWIYYIINYNGKEAHIPVLNSTLVKWTLESYILHYAERGITHYLNLEKLKQELSFKGFTYGAVALMLSQGTPASQTVKDGLLTYSENKTRWMIFADKACSIIQANKNKKINLQKTALARAMWSFILKYVATGIITEKKFIKSLEKYSYLAEKHSSLEQYNKMIIDIYNRRKKSDDKINYYI